MEQEPKPIRIDMAIMLDNMKFLMLEFVFLERKKKRAYWALILITFITLL